VHGCSKENFCLMCVCQEEPKFLLVHVGVRASQYADMIWVVPVLHRKSIVYLLYLLIGEACRHA
jgi:hypothetical protein